MKHAYIAILFMCLIGLMHAQWHIDEGFEGITTLPAGWSFVDDGDGMTWRNYQSATYAHSGTRMVICDNYLPNQNADWLITPQLSIVAGDSLIFHTRSWVSTENLKVYASTTGAQPSNFTHQLANLQGLTTTYRTVSISLSQFAGQNIRLGFFWQCSTYGIIIDDVKVGQNLNVIPELNLPDEISFYQGDSMSLDFAEYIVCTDLQTASLSVAPPQHVSVSITGLSVEFSSPGFSGSEVLTFTLTDGSNGLTASDNISVVVLPPPLIDLALHSVQSPRPVEYLSMPFTPAISIQNNGLNIFNDQVQLYCAVVSDDGTPLQSMNTLINLLLQPGEIAEVGFTDTFTGSSEGVMNLVFEILREDDVLANNTMTVQIQIINRITEGGPDTFGYRFLDSNNPLGPEFDWIDISQTGTSSVMYQVNSWNGDDNFSEPIPLGFPFPFYGNVYTTAHVDINGEILLAPNNWYNAYPAQGWGNDGNMFNYMYPIPGYAQMPALIAVYWDDLYADQGIGDVYFQSFGSSPDRYTVIQWHNLRYLAGSGGSPQLKFQVILYENGEIKMQYHTVATGQSGSVVPHNNGASATVAIQNEAANAGLPYLRELVQNNTYLGVEPAGNLLHDNLAILFYSGEDTQAPIITHKPVGNTFLQTATLKATIIDLSPLTSKTLHYNSGSGWQGISPTYNEGNDYFFELSALPLGATIQYYFSATDAESNTALLPTGGAASSYSFKILPTDNAQVLIAYSGTQDYQRIELPVYEGLLTQLNIAYDTYNWEEFDQYAFPGEYKGILVYANTGGQGDKAQTLATAIMNYLDSGTITNPKNLWFASDGWAANSHALPNNHPVRKLMVGYFRTHYIATGLGGGTNGLAGPNSLNYEHGTILCLPNSPVGTPQQEYAVYANSPDCIFPQSDATDTYWDVVQYPEIGSQYIFAFEDGPIGGQAYLYHGVCATSLELPIYRTLYFSFDFSQLTSPADRYEWMHDLMDWFGLLPVSAEQNHAPEILTGLDKVYPNPFNASTSIRYNVAGKEPVSLAIYNLKGQKVKQLVSETKNPGNHLIEWDGTDNKGDKLASGIYHLRMESGAARSTKRITLIK